MNKPAHVLAWEALEPKRKPPWKPGPDSKIRFATPTEPMSASLFSTTLANLNINRSEFARWIDVDGRTVRNWISGKWPVPLAVGFLVCLMIRTGTRPEDLPGAQDQI